MRSTRFPPDLESKLARAARASGLSVSEILRRGADWYCDRLLADTLADRWRDSIGVFASGGRPSAKKAGRQMSDSLLREQARKRRRRAA